MKKSLLAIASIVFLAACSGNSPAATMTPTASQTPTLTQTETPTQTQTTTVTPSPTPPSPPEFLAQLNDTGFAAAGSRLTYTAPGGETTNVPGEFSVNGFTTTLDSGRVISIPQESLMTMFKVDAGYDLLKVYDENGVISAEYDYAQNLWIDIQKLAADLVCQTRSGACFHQEVTPLPSATDMEARSIGIFRQIKALDKGTGEEIGNLLVAQLITRDKLEAPETVWVLVQAEDYSQSGVNAFVIPGIIMKVQVDKTANGKFDDSVLYDVAQLKTWMPKGSSWTFEFSGSGYIYPFLTFISKSQLGSDGNINKSIKFLTSEGTQNYDDLILLLLASAG